MLHNSHYICDIVLLRLGVHLIADRQSSFSIPVVVNRAEDTLFHGVCFHALEGVLRVFPFFSGAHFHFQKCSSNKMHTPSAARKE